MVSGRPASLRTWSGRAHVWVFVCVWLVHLFQRALFFIGFMSAAVMCDLDGLPFLADKLTAQKIHSPTIYLGTL